MECQRNQHDVSSLCNNRIVNLEADKYLGTLVKEARNLRGLSQQRLAEELNEKLATTSYYKSTITRIEKAERQISASELFALVEILNIELKDIQKIYGVASHDLVLGYFDRTRDAYLSKVDLTSMVTKLTSDLARTIQSGALTDEELSSLKLLFETASGMRRMLLEHSNDSSWRGLFAVGNRLGMTIGPEDLQEANKRDE